MSGPSVVVDCRWLGYSGVGRVTELFLEGLAELAPSGQWTLWGPAEVERYLWAGSRLEPAGGSPLRWAAQRDVLSVPAGDVVLWLHAVRPLSSRRCVVLVHDLIPLHWASNAAERILWKAFMSRSCHTATKVVTYSGSTRDLLISELGIRPDATIPLPLDSARASRIRALRSETRGGPPRLLYVGQVRRHKNVPAAVQGYLASDFCKNGGVFTLVAGGATRPVEIDEIQRLASGSRDGKVEILSRQTDKELDRLYASATMVIQPSLEEGFGLPVVEGLAAGVPVCCSDIPSLTEAAQGRAELFDPSSVQSIAVGIDRTASSAGSGHVPEPPDMPTPAAFAESFVRMIAQALDSAQAASASE